MIDQTTTTHTTSDTPLITVNQINLSAKQLWGVVVAVATLLSTGFAGGYLFVPAKASAVQELSAVVQTVQAQHAETRTQMAALTVEVGKLTGAVDELRGVVSEMKARVASPERTQSRPSPARRAGPSPTQRQAAPGN